MNTSKLRTLSHACIKPDEFDIGQDEISKAMLWAADEIDRLNADVQRMQNKYEKPAECTMLSTTEFENVKTIIQVCCNVFHVSHEEFYSKSRLHYILKAKHVARWACRVIFDWQYQKIGNAFQYEGKPLDHGTIMNSCSLVNAWNNNNQKFADELQQANEIMTWHFSTFKDPEIKAKYNL